MRAWLLLLLVASTGAAAPFSADVTNEHAATVSYDQATVTADALLLAPNAVVNFTGTIDVYRSTVQYAYANEDRVGAFSAHVRSEPAYVLASHHVAGSVQALPLGQTAFIQGKADDFLLGAGEALLEQGSLVGQPHIIQDPRFDVQRVVAGYGFQLPAQDGLTADLTIAGKAPLVYHNQVIVLPAGQSVNLGPIVEGAGVQTIHRHFAVFTGTWATTSAASLVSREVAFSGQLDIVLRDAIGVFDLDGQTGDLNEHVFQVRGDLQATTSNGQWTITGDATYVSIDTVATFDAALIVASGLGLLALLGFLVSSLGREALTLLTGYNFVKDPLENPHRQEIMHHLAIGGVMSRSGLQNHLGLSESGLRHHVMVLTRHNLIQSLDQDGMRFFMLNSSSLKFQAQGHDKPFVADKVLATIADPRRRAIYDALVRLGSKATGPELAEALEKSGHPMSDALRSYHLKHLVEHNVLTKNRQGRTWEYQLNVEEPQVRLQQFRSFLRAPSHSYTPIVRLVHKSPGLTSKELRRVLQQEGGRKMTLTQVRRALRELIVAGIVDRSDGYRVSGAFEQFAPQLLN